MEHIEICYRDKDAEDRIVAWDVSWSEEEIEKMLADNPSWYRSTYTW